MLNGETVKRLVIALMCAAGLVASMGAEGGCTASDKQATDDTGSSDTGTDTSDDDETVTLRPSFYSIRVKPLSKQCFGSAGCNFQGRLVLSYKNAAAKDQAAELTVKIFGDESGTLIETISVDETGNYNAPEILVSTSSSATEVTAKVTEVDTS